MRVLLVGYGQMGRQIEEVLKEKNHEITGRVDPVAGEVGTIDHELAGDSDVAIDFSAPDAVLGNIELYTRFGLNAVVGTTGWSDHAESVEKAVVAGGTGLLHGANFSIGAHIFFALISHAVNLINPLPEYDILAYELHHKRKKDSPSGTALSIAEIILNGSTRKNSLVTEKLDRPPKENELHFASVRGGELPGIHRVVIDSAADTIELSHSVRNRRGFALGAVLGAEWISKRKGFYRVEDFIKEMLERT